MTKRIVLGCLLVASLAATPVFASCAIFQHRDFGGSRWGLGDNDRMIMIEGETIGVTTHGHCPECESTTYFEPSWNDQVSSFTVDGGCTITLWQHINEGGSHFRANQSHSYVGSAWNDQASEALCTCG